MRWCYHRESEVIMDKKYIENQYHLAVLDFQTARSEEAQWEARKTMARLEQIAAQEYGFEYADDLHERELGVQTEEMYQFRLRRDIYSRGGMVIVKHLIL